MGLFMQTPPTKQELVRLYKRLPENQKILSQLKREHSQKRVEISLNRNRLSRVKNKNKRQRQLASILLAEERLRGIENKIKDLEHMVEMAQVWVHHVEDGTPIYHSMSKGRIMLACSMDALLAVPRFMGAQNIKNVAFITTTRTTRFLLQLEKNTDVIMVGDINKDKAFQIAHKWLAKGELPSPSKSHRMARLHYHQGVRTIELCDSDGVFAVYHAHYGERALKIMRRWCKGGLLPEASLQQGTIHRQPNMMN